MQQRKQTAVRQKEIVMAARKLIVTYGSENVTVRKIAHEIGVSEGAIYKHFKSKKAILFLLVDDMENILNADIDQKITGRIGTLEKLENIIIGHISGIEQRKGVTFQVIAEIVSLGDRDLNKKITEAINKYLRRIELILADGVKSGIIRPDINLESAARLYFGMTQGIVNIWALNRYQFSLTSQYKPLWELFLKSVMQPETLPGPCEDES
jgi:AcrR family transcriptional regulator